MKHTPQLLFIDDDRAFSPLVCEFLEGKGFKTTLRHSGEEGIQTFRAGQFDLCILDVKMPFKDGFAVAQEIHALAPETPFLFLSGETEREKRIKGLTLGADDYVTKPFSMEELYLRIQAILRRSGTHSERAAKPETTDFTIGKYQFNAASRQLMLGNEVQKLSAIESKLLRLFCEAENGNIERETALRRVWGDEDLMRGRSLNVYVSKLRQYLAGDSGIELLNVHGEGYQLVYSNKGAGVR